MIIRVKEPNGSVSTTIPLCDIDHVEMHTLNYFNEKAHNLYLFLKKKEHFMVFNYSCPLKMEQDCRELSALVDKEQSLEDANAADVAFELVPKDTPPSLL